MLALISYYYYNLTTLMVHMPFVLMVEEFVNFCFLIVEIYRCHASEACGIRGADPMGMQYSMPSI